MKAKTEEMLTALLWGVEVISAPTWRNLDSSFESWAYRNGFQRRLDYLEREQYLEKGSGVDVGKWVYRLTEKGRLAGLGGRDPERCWNQPWKGQWQMILFDIPQRAHAPRVKLWRWLRANGFGNLQNSLWITPFLDESIIRQWQTDHPKVSAFAVFEGRPRIGATDADIVDATWDFLEINASYQHYLDHVAKHPAGNAGSDEPRGEILEWIRQEDALWRAAIRTDPLLPRKLLPKGYLGRVAWTRRKKTWKWVRQNRRGAAGS